MRLVLSVLIVSLSVLIQAQAQNSNLEDPPHLDLEATSQELRSAIRNNSLMSFERPSGPIQDALAAGDRLLKWLDKINESRKPDDQIKLTSKSTRKGIPITQPNHYSPETVEKALEKLEDEMPQPMLAVLFQSKAYTADPVVSDSEFINYGRQMDKIYQTAARWTALIPYKASLIARRANDVRGYYYLSTNNWTQQRIEKEWPYLSSNQQEELKIAFHGICLNSGLDGKRCTKAVSNLVNSDDAGGFYNTYFPRAKTTWKQFFSIKGARKDISWNGVNATSASIPFYKPNNQDVINFVQINIEDEFKWDNWGLSLNFVNSKPAPYVVFIPGKTANVEYLGGNRIEMDSNKSLSEYEEQWVIRHEFGHVLGLPDCYVEFYDENANEMINYQLDTSDLMCSRAGNMNERIYLELRNEYAKKR